jgi:hypothetical protein
MRVRGHARTIVDGPIPDEDCDEESDKVAPRCITRSEYIEEVKELMQESRGRELPGTYNPLIVAELFSKQCVPWQGMVRSLLAQVLYAASQTIESILRNVADNETADALLSLVVNPAMEKIKTELRNKADEILEPHVSGHPITYNHYLTDNVQNAQAQRRRQRIETELKSFFGDENMNDTRANYYFSVSSLLDAMAVADREPDMDTFSCLMAIDMMEAYYKVSSLPLLYFQAFLRLINMRQGHSEDGC